MAELSTLTIKDQLVLRLEIMPEASKSKVYLDGKDVSARFHTIEFKTKVGSLTEITLMSYQLTSDEPMLIEGVIFPLEDAQEYHEWKTQRIIARIRERRNANDKAI